MVGGERHDRAHTLRVRRPLPAKRAGRKRNRRRVILARRSIGIAHEPSDIVGCSKVSKANCCTGIPGCAFMGQAQENFGKRADSRFMESAHAAALQPDSDGQSRRVRRL